jgi:hypothetical protein
LRGMLAVAGGARPAAGLYPLHVALGRLMAEFGYTNEQYRQPEKN